MSNNNKPSLRLSEEQIRIRVDQGIHLSKVTGRDRTFKARTYGMTSSGHISNCVAVGVMFGEGRSTNGQTTRTVFGQTNEKGNIIDYTKYDQQVVLKTPWNVLTALSQPSKPWRVRVLLTELVLAYIEAEWKGTETEYGFPPDAKAIYALLAHPKLYEEDLEILVAKLRKERGFMLNEDEYTLANLSTPDLYKHVRDNMAQVVNSAASEIELKLDQIQQAVEALDTDVTELELATPETDHLTAFIDEARSFFGSFKADANVLIGQQAQVDALQAALALKEEELQAALSEVEHLKAHNAAITERLNTIETAITLLNESVSPTILEQE